MITLHNEPIRGNKLLDFHEIVKATNGRYVSNPYECNDEYGDWRASVYFENSDDFQEFQKRWRRINLNIVEKARKPSLMKRIKSFVYHLIAKNNTKRCYNIP